MKSAESCGKGGPYWSGPPGSTKWRTKSGSSIDGPVSRPGGLRVAEKTASVSVETARDLARMGMEGEEWGSNLAIVGLRG